MVFIDYSAKIMPFKSGEHEPPRKNAGKIANLIANDIISPGNNHAIIHIFSSSPKTAVEE